MTTDEWKAMLSQFNVRGGPVHPVAPLVLTQYEKAIGIALPHSFKTYCEVFGAGEIDGEVDCRICAPHVKTPRFNIDTINRSAKGTVTFGIVNLDQFARSVFFADDIATSYYFWDPQDVTRRDNNEYGIYVLHRNNKVDKIADTFSGFVHDYCIGTAASDADYVLTFTPAH